MYRIIITPNQVVLEADSPADVAVLNALLGTLQQLDILPQQPLPEFQAPPPRTKRAPKIQAAVDRVGRKKQESRFNDNTDGLYEALQQIGRPAFAREIADKALADGTFTTT